MRYCILCTKVLNIHFSYCLKNLEKLGFKVLQRKTFRRCHKISTKNKISCKKELLVCLIKLVRFCIRSQHMVFLLTYWPREGFIKIHRALKDSERLVLQAVSNKKFLHKAINNKDVYVEYGVAEDMSKDAYSLRHCGDLAALNWSRWLKF